MEAGGPAVLRNRTFLAVAALAFPFDAGAGEGDAGRVVAPVSPVKRRIAYGNLHAVFVVRGGFAGLLGSRLGTVIWAVPIV